MGRCGQECCLGSWIKLSILAVAHGREWFIIISITWIRHPSFSTVREGEESPLGHPYTPIPSHLLLLLPPGYIPSFWALSHSNRLHIRRFPHVQICINNSCSLQNTETHINEQNAPKLFGLFPSSNQIKNALICKHQDLKGRDSTAGLWCITAT